MKLLTPSTKPELYRLNHPVAIDGDTIDSVIVLPFSTFTEKRIRLMDFWAPETNGPTGQAGLACRNILQTYLDAHTCFIRCPSERKDRYGRILARLWADGKIITGHMVLGQYQLTPEQHKIQSDIAKKYPAKVSIRSDAEKAAIHEKRWQAQVEQAIQDWSA